MASFVTKTIRKSGIRKSKSLFFLKTANPFLFHFIKNTIIIIIRFLHQMKDHRCYHFQHYFIFAIGAFTKVGTANF